MKKIILLLCLGISYLTFAQSITSQVIAPSGGFHSNTSGSISYTTAQPLAGNLTSGITLHQGFQVHLSSNEVVSGIGDELHGLRIFPNPVNQHLFIEQQENARFTFHLLDASGKTVLPEKDTNEKSTEIDLKHLAPAMYLLQIQLQHGKWQTLTIIKSN